MAVQLICVHPFANYAKGQLVSNADEVERLTGNRDLHFVRIEVPDAPVLEPVKEEPASKSAFVKSNS